MFQDFFSKGRFNAIFLSKKSLTNKTVNTNIFIELTYKVYHNLRWNIKTNQEWILIVFRLKVARYKTELFMRSSYSLFWFASLVIYLNDSFISIIYSTENDF